MTSRHAHDTIRGLFALVIITISLLALAPAPAEAGPSVDRVSTHADEVVPFYVVQSSVNGEPEFLFAIAQRYLGDGNRFTEIFELNEGRRQPDGGALTVPTSLNPGWILLLPADAEGPGVQFGRIQRPDEPSQPVPTSRPVDPAPAPTPTSAPPSATPTRDTADAAPAAGLTAPPLAAIAIAIVVMLLAALAWWVLRRRRRRAAGTRSTARSRDWSASWTIDSALKIVSAACDAEDIPFPGLYLVTVDGASIHLQLTAPSTRAPSGWSASSDGRIWTAALAHLQRQPVPETGSERFSGLATLGITDAGRLLLDFHRAGGPVSIDGPATAVADVVDGWLAELTGSPWSGSPHVVHLAARGADRQIALDDFIAGASTDFSEKGIAVVDEITSRAQGDALRSLFLSPGFSWIVIVTAPFAGAPWRFTARDGVLSSDLLPDVRYSASLSDRMPTSA
ncbi:hypothetical protein ELQ92_02810 [Labedella populi]|uniref:LysM domain-containing protein n=1 Tax=Labedella populi TaxID=2498850 RepID=A0A444QF89_9MICO|nr:hypothetical protein [Labedella populi]RWZ68184.1 hypothetical protein ELQ92_02810 [Labedella populi]